MKSALPPQLSNSGEGRTLPEDLLSLNHVRGCQSFLSDDS